MDFQDCPSAIIDAVHQVRFNRDNSEERFRNLFWGIESPAGCKSVLVAHFADQLATASTSTIDTYFEQAARLAPFNNDETRASIRHAATSISINDHAEAAYWYFYALQKNRIDLRYHLNETFRENWDFDAPEDVTWQYYLYLSSLKTDGAITRLAEKMERSANGNVVTQFLKSVATLDSPEAKLLFQSYLTDDRTADGVDGPGPQIAETVSIYLSHQRWEE